VFVLSFLLTVSFSFPSPRCDTTTFYACNYHSNSPTLSTYDNDGIYIRADTGDTNESPVASDLFYLLDSLTPIPFGNIPSGGTRITSANFGWVDYCYQGSAALDGGTYRISTSETDFVFEPSGNLFAGGTFTVADNSAVCQDVTVDVSSSQVTIMASDIDSGSIPCGDATLSLSKTEFDCGDVGPQIVTLTVADDNENDRTCRATVTVVDNTLPTAVCQDVTLDVTSGPVTIEASDINNGSSDACGVESLSLDKTEFGSGDVGATPVTLTVADNNGNVNTCDATVFANLRDPNLFDADPNMVGNDAAPKLEMGALVDLGNGIPGLDVDTLLGPVASGNTFFASQTRDALDTIGTKSKAALDSATEDIFSRNP
jgi:hypothetical protein